jgi:hypothetical protein
MAHELNPDAVRSPGDLIVFLNRLREDTERDAAETKRRQAAGEHSAALGALYASFTLRTRLSRSLVGSKIASATSNTRISQVFEARLKRRSGAR